MDQNACSEYFLTEDEILMVKDADRNISARSLTFMIFVIVWMICG